MKITNLNEKTIINAIKNLEKIVNMLQKNNLTYLNWKN